MRPSLTPSLFREYVLCVTPLRRGPGLIRNCEINHRRRRLCLRLPILIARWITASGVLADSLSLCLPIASRRRFRLVWSSARTSFRLDYCRISDVEEGLSYWLRLSFSYIVDVDEISLRRWLLIVTVRLLKVPVIMHIQKLQLTTVFSVRQSSLDNV